MTSASAFLTINGIKIEWTDRGGGRPILFLHSHLGAQMDGPFLDLLAAHGRVVAPVHPGFGRSDLPRGITTVDDIAYLYLDMIAMLGLTDVVVVGASMGGFIAAQMAIKSTARLSQLVFVNPVGIRVGDRDVRDIADIFAMVEDDFIAHAFHDPAKGRRDYKAMPDEEVLIAARNREGAAKFLWSPYMHDIKLKARMHRIDKPSLVLWGAQDRLAPESYGRAFAAEISGARFETIAEAGHLPHLEQPHAIARKVADVIARQAAG